MLSNMNNNDYYSMDCLLAAKNLNTFTALQVIRSMNGANSFEPVADESFGTKLRKFFRVR